MAGSNSSSQHIGWYHSNGFLFTLGFQVWRPDCHHYGPRDTIWIAVIQRIGQVYWLRSDHRSRWMRDLTIIGMIKRWHRSLKTTIICHNAANWVEVLPTVLLGLRTSFKEDIKTNAAELVYGTQLNLPGEFFLNEEMPSESQSYVEKFREHMRSIKAKPAAHHSKKKAFAHKTLYACTHVYVRIDAVKRPLEPSYKGPFEVIERLTDPIFKINYKNRPTNISTERFKPAFYEVENTEESAPREIRTYSNPKKTVIFKD